MRFYSDIGILAGPILLPGPTIDPQKWSIIACDQFTSQAEYWRQVDRQVSDSFSTLNLVLPEIYLGTQEEGTRTTAIKEKSRTYLSSGRLKQFEGMIYVERRLGENLRHGLVVSVDLEQYGFEPNSSALIRATEETIRNRLPARVRIRQETALETSHILVLIDDPAQSVIEPLSELKSQLEPLYDFELMLDSGRIAGFGIPDEKLEQKTAAAFKKLIYPTENSRDTVGLSASNRVLFLVGDGNHSLASAKVYWDSIKPSVDPYHPARFALVEIVNLHDPGIKIEPIHRLLTRMTSDSLEKLMIFLRQSADFHPVTTFQEMADRVVTPIESAHQVGMITSDRYGILSFPDPSSTTPVGTLQAVLDQWMDALYQGNLDFIHDADAIHQLARQSGNIGFFLPAISKHMIFPTILQEGILPRKSFSMGDAREKRFYMECRKIIW